MSGSATSRLLSYPEASSSLIMSTRAASHGATAAAAAIRFEPEHWGVSREHLPRHRWSVAADDAGWRGRPFRRRPPPSTQ